MNACLRATILLFALVCAAPAVAQTQAAALATAVEAQYRAAVLRERRIADERELALIAQAETDMRAARTALGAARSESAAANAALEQARADYVRVVNAIPIEDATLRVELEAFRAEIAGRLPEATPDLIEAYRQFADGDRASAWTTLEALLRARAQARRAAARAVAGQEMRQLARLRLVMRANGEARTSDVLRLWQDAAEIDPSHFDPYFQIGSLSFTLGNLQQARAGALRALEFARNDIERAAANATLANIEYAMGDFAAARALMEANIAGARAHAAAEPSVGAEKAVLAMTALLGTIVTEQGDYVAAERILDDAVARARQFAEAHSDERPTLVMLLSARVRVDLMRGNFSAALTQARQMMDLANATLEAMPSSQEAKATFIMAALTMGVTVTTQGSMYAAGVAYDVAATVGQRMVEFDPGDLGARRTLASSHGLLGEVLLELRENEAARSSFDAAVNAAREALAVEPASINSQTGLAVALDQRADLAMRERNFAQAVTLMDEVVSIYRGVDAVAPSLRNSRSLISSVGGLADARADGGERDAARTLWRESIAMGQALIRDAPNDYLLHKAVYTSMQRLAVYFPNGDVRWADLVAYMEEMDRRGLLAPIDRDWLEDARRRAAQQAGAR